MKLNTYKLSNPYHKVAENRNLASELVRSLMEGNQAKGQYTVVWNGKNDESKLCADGVYVILYKAAGIKEIEKIILIR